MIEKKIPVARARDQMPGDPEHLFEYLVIAALPGEHRSVARAALREHSEYGKWELVRTCLYEGGGQKYWMRRRVMRVKPTLNIRG
ncbi:DUF5703 family protein [Paeniglutamicibacter sp. ORCA_105]|jgi:hypothetical protein|uniref:DUF5703 family protein n=1 Tax=Paeniglutamicibacter sp. ORCA_105 TaxID=3377336 RepID=UPI0038945BC4